MICRFKKQISFRNMGSARLTTGIMLKMVLVNLIRLNARVLRFDKQAVFYQRTTVQLPLN